MKYIIEFRNGSFFGSLNNENGCKRGEAKQFVSKKKAESFMRKHEWILVNGGMAVKAA